MKLLRTYLFFSLVSLLFSCKESPKHVSGVFDTPGAPTGMDLDVIQMNGELIVVAMYGSDTYFEYYGEGYGKQYLIASQYAKSIGCAMRIDVMPDSVSMMQRLSNGEADIALFADADRWQVRSDAPMLAESVHQWVDDNRKNFEAMTTIRVSDEHGRVYTPRRRSYSPMLNASAGQISRYDHLFRHYASQCGWDWRLLAAQAYQESAFDADAVSYMGALGLMQLMPRTAASMGVSVSQAFNPETNLSGAVRYISKLNRHYSSIADPGERINFVLAAYNGGEGHIDDARRLAAKLGHNPDRWTQSVDQVVLHLSEPRYFNDPVVKRGYMRGSETYNYVYSIRDRWEQYKRAVGH